MKCYSKTAILALLIPVIVIVFLYGNGSIFKNHYDDAYITYRYAANLASGKGLVFNVDERTDAASSPLYTFILAAFYKAGLTDLELVSISLSILSASGICFFVYKSILAVTTRPFLALFLSFITALHGFISGWAVSGMESLFFTFLIVAFIYQYYFRYRKDNSLVTNFIFILTMISILIARQESVILLFVWFFAEFHKKFIQKEDHKKIFILQTVVFLTTILSLYFFHYKYYGSILSNALLFKKIALYYQPNPLELFKIWGGTSLIISILAFCSLFIPKSKKLMSLYAYIFLSFISFAIGPYSDGARYSIHAFPLLVILSSLSISHIATGNLYRNNKLIVMFLLSLISLQTLLSSVVTRYYMISLKKGSECRREVGIYINNTLTSSDYVLSSDLGMIAYQAINVRFIDLASLTSKDVLTHYQEKKTIDDIILYKKPAFLAGSFYMKDKLITPKEIDKAEHTLLNKDPLIIGIQTYTKLPFQDVFRNVLYQCSDQKRLYAIVDLKPLYKNYY